MDFLAFWLKAQAMHPSWLVPFIVLWVREAEARASRGGACSRRSAVAAEVRLVAGINQRINDPEEPMAKSE